MLSFKSGCRSTAIVFALSSTIHAGTMGAVMESSFVGAYGGIMGGVVDPNTSISASANSTFQSGFTQTGPSDVVGSGQLRVSQDHVHVYSYSGIGDIYLGYGQFVRNSKFFLAGELSGNWAKRKNSASNAANRVGKLELPSIFNFVDDSETLTTSTTANLHDGEFDADIRPGYQFDINSMVYGRMGVAVNSVKITTTSNFTYTNLLSTPTVTYYSSLSQSGSRNVAGLRLGAGLEHYMGKNLSITADYVYTYYGKVNIAGTVDTESVQTISSGGDTITAPFTNINGLVAQSSVRLTTQAAMLGLKYYFSDK